MRRAVRTPEFWLLAGTFFVCGSTSNGLVGQHFIAHAVDHGFTATIAVDYAIAYVTAGWMAVAAGVVALGVNRARRLSAISPDVP